MAADFIGRRIIVTLKDPANTVLEGVVANVDQQTATLYLHNVNIPATNQRMSSFRLESSLIADLKLLEAPPVPPTKREVVAVKQTQDVPTPTQAKPPTSRAPQPFNDPAILSYGPGPSAAQSQPSAPVAKAPSSAVPNAVKGIKSQTDKTRNDLSNNQRRMTATLTEPFSNLGLGVNTQGNAEGEEESDDPTVVDGGRRVSLSKTRTSKPIGDTPPTGQKGRKRKSKSARQQQVKLEEPPAGIAEILDSSPEAVRRQTNPLKGKGWRQTPILQDQPTFSPAPKTPSKGSAPKAGSARKTRNQRVAEQAQNGWATEDATDIQDLPEFNFEENLGKFDKRSVFEQIRNGDTTADEDRLVSLNRLPRPGTFGGQKLHPTENVLEKALQSDEFTTSEDDLMADSGRNSRRAMSRASTKRRPFGSTGGIHDELHNNALNMSASSLLKQSQGVSTEDSFNNTQTGIDDFMAIYYDEVEKKVMDWDVLSDSSSLIQAALRSTLQQEFMVNDFQHSRSLNKPAYSSSHTNSPRIGTRYTPPESPSASGPPMLQPSAPPQSAHFAFTASNRLCPTIGPGGMVAIEEYAEIELGLTEPIMAEAAGHGIAEVCLSALNPGGRRLAQDNVRLNSKPVLVVLVGNHKPGSRAVAAARHLHGRGIRVIVCVLGLERGKDALEHHLKTQLSLFRKIGGAIGGWTHVTQALKKLDGAPIELVLDALLAPGNRGLEGLGTDDVAHALEMIKWANGLRSSVGVCVDVPSGVHGGTGTFTIPSTFVIEANAEEGETTIYGTQPLFIRSKHAVCLGAPMTGLLRATQPGGANEGRGLKIWVVDIGINKAWKVYGPPGAARGVRFGAEWVAGVEYVEGE